MQLDEEAGSVSKPIMYIQDLEQERGDRKLSKSASKSSGQNHVEQDALI